MIETLTKNKPLMIILSVCGLLFFLFLAWKFTATPAQQQAVEIKLSPDENIKGDKNAPVTIVEYSDFQCPACKAYEPIMQSLVKKYDKKVRLVYRHFPLTQIHQNATAGSQAAEAAKIQGKFWEMHDMLFDKQDEWATEKNPYAKFESYAKELKLDLKKFKSDFDSKEVKGKVQQDVASGNQVGLEGTPTFIVNNKKLIGLRGGEDIEKAIQEAITATTKK